MVGFCDFTGFDYAPVSKNMAVNAGLVINDFGRCLYPLHIMSTQRLSNSFSKKRRRGQKEVDLKET